MAILLLKRGKIEFLPINIRNKEGRYMLVVYALGRIFDTHKSEYFLYQMKAEIIYFVCHFMSSLRINGFKTDAPYNAMYSR